MKLKKLLFLIIPTLLEGIIISTLLVGCSHADVAIVVSENASETEQLAANELQRYLTQLYPSEQFLVAKDGLKFSAEKTIWLGTITSRPDLAKHVDGSRLTVANSFVVSSFESGGQANGIILGADGPGLMHGVYGLLEQLGCGFFISFDTMPKPSGHAFDFEKWELANQPLTPVRLVFNWHNFLSGCSGWDLKHWEKWITQSQKCGYNTVMVHAYGNNPMFTFDFKGKTKPVGYLTTTERGRDWAANHVNDARRLHGGFLFDEAVYGSEAGKGPEDQLVEAVQSMMYKTFEHARQRGMKVNFALDFDIPACNPEEMILQLDESDRFKVRGDWLARPDTPAGYEFYKAQAKALMKAYPQINTVTLWRRTNGFNGATWPVLKFEEMPASWQAELTAMAEAEKDPKLVNSAAPFGMAKVAKAWRKALNEVGREDVELATGSWGYYWMPGIIKFFPEDVKIIPLDSTTTRANKPDYMEMLDGLMEDGRMIPVIWSQHDDGEYIGAPRRVHPHLNSDLKDWGAGGFGIIHWQTHPLDIYFANHGRQTWAITEDETLADTCAWAAERYFGTANQAAMTEYLVAWMEEMPVFGRETGDRFIDKPMEHYATLDEAVSGCSNRVALLNKADLSQMSKTQIARHQFYKDYEQFIADFFKTQYRFEAAKSAHKNGKLEEARKLIAGCNPEALVERYARLFDQIGITRGEEGVVVSMNTRWIPHYVRFRQIVGLEPVRFNYAKTSHDDLAQSVGRYTFHVTPDQALWQTFGDREAGATAYAIPGEIKLRKTDGVPAGYEEICRSGIESEKSISTVLSPIVHWDKRASIRRDPLPAGQYKVSLMMAEPTVSRAGERVMDLEIGLERASALKRYTFSPVKTKYLRLLCRGSKDNDWNSIHEIAADAIDKNVPATASGSQAENGAALVIDGDLETRWAAKGEHWIQVGVLPETKIDHIDVKWYAGRLVDFDIQVSEDAETWTTIKHTEAVTTQAVITDTIDIYKRAGGKNCAVMLDYPITLSESATLSVTLQPVKGKALICGAVLTRVDAQLNVEK